MARRLYAFTIPRDRWTVRVVMLVSRILMAIIRCGFRPYVHDVTAIDRGVMQAGFVRVFEEYNLMWLTRVYARRLEP